MSLSSFFLYFGSKSKLARRYPPPAHGTIIEPFAGSAAYSVRHHHRSVLLIDKDPVVVGIWSFLLKSSAREILALPELGRDQRVEDLACCQEARWLIGRWIDFGAKEPAKKRSPWGADEGKQHRTWGRTVRARLAAQVGKIRHWRVMHEATWFVDPPYQKGGLQYTGDYWDAPDIVSSAGLDFAQLGEWCRERRGQVVVCEERGADWLPFRHLADIRSVGQTTTGEVVWTNDEAAA